MALGEPETERVSLPLRAAIFDMDGLLVDSEPLWRSVEREVFGGVGVPLTDAMCSTTKGLRIDEVVHHWRTRFPWRGPSNMELVDRIVTRMASTLRSEGVAKPGVRHAVDTAQQAGLALALASSSHMEVIRAVLERLDIAGAFEVICSGEAEPYGKPHPGIFITTARELGVAPTECVVLEDSIHGVVAAKAARMRCVAVPEETAPAFAVADAVLDSLELLRAAHLLGE